MGLLLEEVTGATTEIVDLRDLDLPLLDEPKMPALGGYVHEHTKRWSALVDESDAIVLVTPQYNGGYPAPLKNAIDYLYREWHGKPMLVVSYGGRGGGMAAAQLVGVLGVVGADLVTDPVQITLRRASYGVDGRLVAPEADIETVASELQAAGEALAKELRAR
ncbi:NADPH-dependent FMN reductase [Nocardioides albertanoniae]|uniref:NADPH-dependent FMN reductase n=1 Tax=Nocardioides albertanoniae TaxID=1175486 RepID=UPI001FECDAC9